MSLWTQGKYLAARMSPTRLWEFLKKVKRDTFNTAGGLSYDSPEHAAMYRRPDMSLSEMLKITFREYLATWKTEEKNDALRKQLQDNIISLKEHGEPAFKKYIAEWAGIYRISIESFVRGFKEHRYGTPPPPPGADSSPSALSEAAGHAATTREGENGSVGGVVSAAAATAAPLPNNAALGRTETNLPEDNSPGDNSRQQ